MIQSQIGDSRGAEKVENATAAMQAQHLNDHVPRRAGAAGHETEMGRMSFERRTKGDGESTLGGNSIRQRARRVSTVMRHLTWASYGLVLRDMCGLG